MARRRSVELGPRLVHAWRTAIADSLGAAALDTSITVGLTGVLGAQEDLDQIRAHACAVTAALPQARLVVGDIDELRVDQDGAWLRTMKLDVLFRYYPLDWCATPTLRSPLNLVAAGRLVMIPTPAAVVSQSKAFLAPLHELEGRGFFPPEDAGAILRYVPLTTLDPRPFGRSPWVAKPFFEREGHGVHFSGSLGPAERRRLDRAGVVFQRRLDLVSARVPVASAREAGAPSGGSSYSAYS